MQSQTLMRKPTCPSQGIYRRVLFHLLIQASTLEIEVWNLLKGTKLWLSSISYSAACLTMSTLQMFPQVNQSESVNSISYLFLFISTKMTTIKYHGPECKVSYKIRTSRCYSLYWFTHMGSYEFKIIIRISWWYCEKLVNKSWLGAPIRHVATVVAK